MNEQSKDFDAADTMVSLALEMTLGGRETRDLTASILERHRANPEGIAMNLPDTEILAAPKWVLSIDDRAWTWIVNAASIVALVSLTWMLVPASDERSELPATPQDEERDEKSRPAPHEVRTAVEIAQLPTHHTAIRAYGSEIRDPELQQLCERLPNLEMLELYDTNVTDDGLSPLKSMASLRSLGVPLCARLTDRALDLIAGLKELEELDVTGFVGQTASIGGELPEDYVDPFSKFTSRGLTRLAQLPRLRRLELFGTRADDAALKRILERGSTELTSLGLGHTAVTNATLGILAARDRVRELDIVSANALTENRSLEIVAGIESLRTLAIGGNGFGHADYTSAGIYHLSKLRLRSLRVNSSSLMGRGNGWGMVARIVTLEELEVRDCKNFGDDDVAILAQLPRLRSLKLGWTEEITDNLLEIIENSSLTEVDLTAFGQLDVEVLKKLWEETPRLRRLTLPDGKTVLTRVDDPQAAGDLPK